MPTNNYCKTQNVQKNNITFKIQLFHILHIQNDTAFNILKKFKKQMCFQLHLYHKNSKPSPKLFIDFSVLNPFFNSGVQHNELSEKS